MYSKNKVTSPAVSYQGSNLVEDTEVSPIAIPVAPTSPLPGPNIIHKDWLSYTSKDYGFSFQYPPTWSFNPQDKKTLNLGSNNWSSSGPSETLLFQVIDDPTYYIGGDLKYDEFRKGFVDTSKDPNRCHPVTYSIGAFKQTAIALPVYQINKAYTATASSGNYAILTNRGYYLFISEMSVKPATTDTAEVSDIYRSIRFHDAVKAVESPCQDSQDEWATIPPKISQNSPIIITSPVRGAVWLSGATHRINWKVNGDLKGSVGVYLSSRINGWGCLLGAAPVNSTSFTIAISVNQACPNQSGMILESGEYSLSLGYPFETIDPFGKLPEGGAYGDGSGYFVPINLISTDR